MKTKKHPDQLPLSNTFHGPLTRKQIARLFGVSRQRIEELEERAMKKIARAIESDPALKACLLDHLENEPQPRQNFYKLMRDH